jgi:hypothetical protein
MIKNCLIESGPPCNLPLFTSLQFTIQNSTTKRLDAEDLVLARRFNDRYVVSVNEIKMHEDRERLPTARCNFYSKYFYNTARH